MQEIILLRFCFSDKYFIDIQIVVVLLYINYLSQATTYLILMSSYKNTSRQTKMMSHIKAIFFSILVLMLSVLVACKKEPNVVTPSANHFINGGGGGGGGGNTNSILDFFMANAVKNQSFIINLTDSNATIVGTSGTNVTFLKNSLLLQGQVYTGDIKISMTEIYDQLNMILSDKTTLTTDGKSLISGGQIYMNATTIDGQPLQIRDSSFFLVKMPIDSALQSGMTSFSGSIDTSGNVQWLRSNPDTAKAFTADPLDFDSTWYKNLNPVFYYTSSQYIFTVNKLGWINCAKFWKINAKINIGVTCISPCTIRNTRVFVTYRNTNSAAGCYHNGTAFMANGVPAGYAATIVAIGYDDGDGKQYFSVKDTTASNNINITLNLVQSSQDSIKSVLALKIK